MSLPAFKHSAALTMGVELELQLVDNYDFDLTSSAGDVLELFAHEMFPGDVKREITDSMIEVATGVHTHHAALLQQLEHMRDALVSASDRLNIGICGGGTHPFQRWFERKVSDEPRFQYLSGLYGYLAKQFTVFGQHVHIGCSSANEALYLLHALNRYVPHFVALSASSPYRQGTDTQFDSARFNSVLAFPLSGSAPFLLDWGEFAQGYFEKMTATSVVQSMKDFYWDIRPKPEFGTIELRVCDTPLTVRRAAAIACYLQALCSLLLTEREAPEPDDYLVYSYNRFQASRFGLEGVMIHPRSHAQLVLRDDIRAMLQRLEPYASALASAPMIEELRRVLDDGNDAALLRREYAGGVGIQGVVVAAVDEFRSKV